MDFSNDFLDYAIAHQFGDFHFNVDTKTGMKAIIAIHNTKLGPALGGCRFIDYPDTLSALYDALRLARGMSYKAALAKLPFGGGKSVIIKPKGDFDRKKMFARFGDFVNDLNGRYITALDSGTTLDDMDIIGSKTPFVASLTSQGNPSPSTALGIFLGLKAAVAFKLNATDLKGLHVAVQGLGHVGYELCEHLHQAGVQLSVSDVDKSKVEKAVAQFKANAVDNQHIHATACDVFSPCALGGILNEATIAQLQTTVIAGAANNQLEHTQHGQLLHDKGVLYTPDYVINAGGLMFAAHQYLKSPGDDLDKQLQHIPAVLLAIFARSRQENRPCSAIADTMAEELLFSEKGASLIR